MSHQIEISDNGLTKIPSQIFPRQTNPFSGPLLRATGPGQPYLTLNLYLIPAEPHGRETISGHANAPSALWHIPERKIAGPLTPLSFIAVFTEKMTSFQNITINTIIEDPETLAALPFVHRHSSGFYQSIRFEGLEAGFTRRILYITGEAP